MTHTSQTYYLERTKNFVIQYAPVLNGVWPCANQELVSLTPIAQPERHYTAYGIDSPIPNLDDAWLCQCTGHLSHVSDHVAFLAWGSDVKGLDWVVLYSAPPPDSTFGLPSQISIMSRDGFGPDEETVNKIKDGIYGLGDVELSKMIDNLRPLKHDHIAYSINGNPDFSGRPACGYNVLQNVDSLTRF